MGILPGLKKLAAHVSRETPITVGKTGDAMPVFPGGKLITNEKTLIFKLGSRDAISRDEASQFRGVRFTGCRL